MLVRVGGARIGLETFHRIAHVHGPQYQPHQIDAPQRWRVELAGAIVRAAARVRRRGELFVLPCQHERTLSVANHKRVFVSKSDSDSPESGTIPRSAPAA